MQSGFPLIYVFHLLSEEQEGYVSCDKLSSDVLWSVLIVFINSNKLLSPFNLETRSTFRTLESSVPLDPRDQFKNKETFMSLCRPHKSKHKKHADPTFSELFECKGKVLRRVKSHFT